MDYWRAVSGHLIVLLLLLAPLTAWANDRVNTYTIEQVDGGALISFRDVDYRFSRSMTPPVDGWQRGPTPQIFRASVLNWPTGVDRALWGRYRFDRAALGDEPLAIYMLDSRVRLVVSVNGQELFRNFADPTAQKLSWYRPFLVPIPATVLRPGSNEILIRASSDESLAVGRLVVGPHRVLERQYLWTYFWRINAPKAANFAMLVLGGFAFAIWLIRRHEIELLYLTLMTVFSFARNFQYFGEEIPFNQTLFNAMSIYSTYFGGLSGFAFYLTFVKHKSRDRLLKITGFTGIALCLMHWFLPLPDTIIYLPTTLIGFIMMYICLFDQNKYREFGNIFISMVVIIVPVFSIYDIYLFSVKVEWDADDFFLVVFNGFLYCLAFLISFGKRAHDALNDLGKANQTLEQRVATVRAELIMSEAARQELMVAHAVAGERGRLMQEIHDGIGSNLITALAVARRQNQPGSTIRTLNRALADLKITVDSLEPVEGDLVALIGNLRHRMAGDLREAGIACKWEVQPCQPLSWLDASNALHVLRIFQEAIGNVLAHSGASEMRIGCKEQEHDGVAGIAAYVADNGCGFDTAIVDHPGKGVSNGRARAQSLHGQLDYASSPEAGTVVTLWLPYHREHLSQ